MLDQDDIRYSRGEERPPWELSTAGQLREMFSCRKVEEFDGKRTCSAVDEQKEERIRAQKKRQDAHARLEEQRRLRQQTMSAGKQEDVPVETEDEDEEEEIISEEEIIRFVGGDKSRFTPEGRRAKKNKAVIIIVGIVLAVNILGGIMAGVRGSFEETAAPESFDDGFAYDPEEDAEQWEEFFGDVVPRSQAEADEDGEYPVIDRHIPENALELEIRSAEGLTPLTYQELYAKCAPSTVSILVKTPEGSGTGTGIVMSADGYILTCQHVVEDAITCKITTWDDRTFDAKLVGSDAQTDLAVMKVEAEDLVPAQFGDSDELTVGDEALAIGDPLGVELRGTLTNGIISAINRNVTVNRYSMTLIQTTAALNSGNSGGPLLNIYGQVVGVNNMKMNSTDVTVEGLGFAVPTKVVREIIPVLSTEGKVSRPVLGITCYGVTQEMVEEYGEPTTGLLVASVDENSDAYVQGVEVGDYIYSVNDVPVTSVGEVKEIIKDLEIGDTIDLLIYRPVTQEDEEEIVLEELELTIALVDQSELAGNP